MRVCGIRHDCRLKGLNGHSEVARSQGALCKKSRSAWSRKKCLFMYLMTGLSPTKVTDTAIHEKGEISAMKTPCCLILLTSIPRIKLEMLVSRALDGRDR